MLLLAWLDPLLWRGFRKPLDEDDTHAVPKLHSARSVRGRVEAFRAAYPDATFTSAILRTFVLRWLAGFCSKCVFVTAYLFQPFWVGSLITYINDRMLGRYTESSVYFWGFHKGLHLAAGLVVTSLVAILAVNHTFYHQTRYDTYLRTAVSRAEWGGGGCRCRQNSISESSQSIPSSIQSNQSTVHISQSTHRTNHPTQPSRRSSFCTRRPCACRPPRAGSTRRGAS